MRILTFREQDVPPDLRLQQVRLQEQAWPTDGGPDPAPWHDPSLAPVCMLLLVDGCVVSALDLLTKEIEHGGQVFRAIGLSAVVTDAERRGEGLGGTLVRAARATVTGRADLAAFTCDPELGGFYAANGWELLPGTVVVGGTPDDPYPSDALGKVTLGAFLSARGEAARGSIVGGRIELYPGTIDRLW